MNLSRAQVASLIDKLANKSLTFGCRVEFDRSEQTVINTCGKKVFFLHGSFWVDDVDFKILGHSVLIGDVLAKEMHQSRRDELVRLWLPCGADKSLQQIVADSGWEDRCGCDNSDSQGCRFDSHFQILKSPQANNLFSFLHQIFNDSN